MMGPDVGLALSTVGTEGVLAGFVLTTIFMDSTERRCGMLTEGQGVGG